MKKYFVYVIIELLALNSCGEETTVLKKESISGYVQKGPFINGTSISINELRNDLSQTGKVFYSQITDNKGSFEATNIELISDFVSLRADGFYFNEVLGTQSGSQITLYALSDVSDKTTINTNILSHLEKPRVEYLVANGTSFSEAKAQAQAEILDIFSFNRVLSESSEVLDISQLGDDNAVLLAISLILQGYRSEAELTELLSNISNDIKEDGVLNSNSLGSKLINHAVYLDTTIIRNNLESRYADLGVNAVIPNFEKYLRNFIDSTSYPITESLIDYPEVGLFGENILFLDEETSYIGDLYSMAANLAKSTSLKIKVTALGQGQWFWNINTINWSAGNYDNEKRSRVFTAIDSGKSCDMSIGFETGEYLIEYFEMGSIIPTRSKRFSFISNRFQ